MGGIGMSALAQLYHVRGVAVSGCDREPSVTTKLLSEKGISVYVGQCANNIPPRVDLVVYSDAVPFDNAERALLRERGIPEQSYFEALGDVSRDFFTIAVAGSHGKTTTTALVGKMLQDQGVNPTVIVGSIVTDFGSNFLQGEPSGPLVVEACEYKDHLLKLSPQMLVVTNVEWDHTDYFKTFEQLKETFKTAVQRLPENGTLVVNMKTPMGAWLASHSPCRVVDYSTLSVPRLNLLGEFNAYNARAAKATALAYKDFPEAALDVSLSQFKGTWRRFEYKGVAPGGAEVYDDYAHHPTEVKTTLEAMREKFPTKKIIVAFHPHLYSRTRDLMEEFSHAFGAADAVIVAPIYAAREEPIPGVTSEALVQRIQKEERKAVAALSLEDTFVLLKKFDQPDTVLITMGAGDIYKVAERLL